MKGGTLLSIEKDKQNSDLIESIAASTVGAAIEAMSFSYESIFMVDLVNGKIEVNRKNPKLPQVFWDFVATNPSYDELLLYYIKNGVVPNNQDQMYEAMCLESIREILKKQSSYSYDYRVKRTDDYVWYRMRVADFSADGELSLFAVGFEKITEEKRVEEFKYNNGKKVLIVEDTIFDREILSSSIERDYEILKASDGEEGWNILQNEYKNIAIVILNLEMPICDGYEFLERYNSEKKYKSIPVIATTGQDVLEAEVRSLELGASEFLRKPYNVEVVRHRVNSLIRLRNATALINNIEKDPLTDFYNRDFFYKRVEEIINDNPDENYRIVVSDIEKFKIVNEKYGIDAGDSLLRFIADSERKHVPGLIIGGRIGADILVILQKDMEIDREQGMELFKKIIQDAPIPNIVMKYGIYRINKDKKMSAQAMCDRANLALNSIKGVYGRYSAVYDDNLRQELLIQQQIIDNMEKSLENKEFKVYLQPKFDVKLGKVAGAEALVRWIHPELGFMNPGVFIPLFEKNGFIKNLDDYVLKDVCNTLVRWRSEGKELVPISVNLSRRDFEDEDLADNIIEYIDSMKLSHDLIHFELTESAFTDNPALISKTIEQLHDAGFVIALDDFGKGYSSITTLNSIDIDFLKLDMSIIQNDVPGSERNVLEFCMQLVKMMNLKSVAEGAETKAQVDRLTDIGCDLIQGFYFSKPLSIEDFEKYMTESNN